MKVIQIIGLANGMDSGGAEGQYVHRYNPDGNMGRGDLILTHDKSKAKRYMDFKQATDDWRRISTTHPVRHDGKPNRPMTAFTIQVKNANGD